MRANKVLLALVAGVSLLVASASVAAAASRTHHRQYVAKPYYYAPRYANAGGWRHRNTVRGWDHSCLNVPWLSNMFACDAK